jgi:hypothetical protein
MRIFIGVIAAFLSHAAFALDSDVKIRLQHERYLSGGQSQAQALNYTFIFADLDIEEETSKFQFKLNPIAQDALGMNDEFYFGVPEFYMQLPSLAPGLSLTIGRQKRVWSRLDEEFNLGVWQPQLRWDYLEPQQEGLIGIFFDLAAGDGFRVTFFTSPVFLPDQDPNYRLNNGQFTSSNRWFSQPQSRVALFSESNVAPETPLYFEIDRPSEKRIIMNSSFGLGLSYQSASPFWIALNYAYKPQNQLHLGIECATCLNIGGPLEVTAIIHPEVIQHHVITLESGFDQTDRRGYLSLTGDFPKDSDFPAQYAESPLDSMIIAGGAFQQYLFSWFGLPSWLKVSYLHVYDLESRNKNGIVDSDAVHSSLDRYPYREVAAVEWKWTIQQKPKNHLEFKTRYAYSVPENGAWLSAALDWGMGPLNWNFGGDIIGSGVSDDSPNAGLFTRYRSNDRLFGEVSYVF